MHFSFSLQSHLINTTRPPPRSPRYSRRENEIQYTRSINSWRRVRALHSTRLYFIQLRSAAGLIIEDRVNNIARTRLKQTYDIIVQLLLILFLSFSCTRCAHISYGPRLVCPAKRIIHKDVSAFLC